MRSMAMATATKSPCTNDKVRRRTKSTDPTAILGPIYKTFVQQTNEDEKKKSEKEAKWEEVEVEELRQLLAQLELGRKRDAWTNAPKEACVQYLKQTYLPIPHPKPLLEYKPNGGQRIKHVVYARINAQRRGIFVTDDVELSAFWFDEGDTRRYRHHVLANFQELFESLRKRKTVETKETKETNTPQRLPQFQPQPQPQPPQPPQLPPEQKQKREVAPDAAALIAAIWDSKKMVMENEIKTDDATVNVSRGEGPEEEHNNHKQLQMREIEEQVVQLMARKKQKPRNKNIRVVRSKGSRQQGPQQHQQQQHKSGQKDMLRFVIQHMAWSIAERVLYVIYGSGILKLGFSPLSGEICQVEEIGSVTAPGFVDGLLHEARFSLPTAIGCHPKTGDVFIADSGQKKLRVITTHNKSKNTNIIKIIKGQRVEEKKEKVVRTLAWECNPGTHGLVLDHYGNLYMSHAFDHVVVRIAAADVEAMVLDGKEVGMEKPKREKEGKEPGKQKTPKKKTVPCMVIGKKGSPDHSDHLWDKAFFNNPMGLTVDYLNYVYVADQGNGCVRKIAPATGMVMTVLDPYSTKPQQMGYPSYAALAGVQSICVEEESLSVFGPDLANQGSLRRIFPMTGGFAILAALAGTFIATECPVIVCLLVSEYMHFFPLDWKEQPAAIARHSLDIWHRTLTQRIAISEQLLRKQSLLKNKHY